MFGQVGLAALDDAPRPGRPKIYGPEARLRIIAAATSATPPAQPAWTHRLLAEEVSDLGLSPSQVGRILAQADLKPRRVRGWLTRPADPDFSPRPPTCARSTGTDHPARWCRRWMRRPRSPPGPANTPTSANNRSGHGAGSSSTSATAPSDRRHRLLGIFGQPSDQPRHRRIRSHQPEHSRLGPHRGDIASAVPTQRHRGRDRQIEHDLARIMDGQRQPPRRQPLTQQPIQPAGPRGPFQQHPTHRTDQRLAARRHKVGLP